MKREHILRKAILVLGILGALCLAVSLVARGTGFLFLVAGLLCFLAAFLCALHLPYTSKSARRLAKIFKWVAYPAVLIGLISFIAIEGLIVSAWPNADREIEADCLIVLGAGLNGERLSYVLHSRISMAADYLLEHPDCLVIVSGGQGPGESITEALAMKRFLLEQGIAESRILMEAQSTSTVENLRFSRKILAQNGLLDARVAVVSNSFHLYRARWLADYLGLEIETMGVRTPNFPLTPMNSYVREYFSIVLMYVKAATGTL